MAVSTARRRARRPLKKLPRVPSPAMWQSFQLMKALSSPLRGHTYPPTSIRMPKALSEKLSELRRSAGGETWQLLSTMVTLYEAVCDRLMKTPQEKA